VKARKGGRGIVPVDDALLRGWPLPMTGDGGKEDRGRVLIVAGSEEIAGPVVLAATAALRAGAGKVTLAVPESIALQAAFAVPESRVIALDEGADGAIAAKAGRALEELCGKVAALLIGPGLAYADSNRALTLSLLEMFDDASTVVDAAAMDVVMKPGGLVSSFTKPVVLTPHAGEMAKLTGGDKDEIERNPVPTARKAAKKWNAIVALKNAVTHIASHDGSLWRHEGGNAGLATSGSGDVLAGIIAGLLARGADLEQAAVWGVALHGRAGERLADNVGPLGYLARELSAEVPALMASFGDANRPPR
jgi:ADP-dependent NAD(P)H-hydrate dehydratase